MKDKLIEIASKAYAPYSNFHVAAIVIMKDGKHYEGVNVENASYGATICAERVAILKAVSEGYRKGDFKELHVLCADSKTISTCCFLCRQVISEFFEDDAMIYCHSITGEFKGYKVSTLCPFPFNEDDLK